MRNQSASTVILLRREVGRLGTPVKQRYGPAIVPRLINDASTTRSRSAAESNGISLMLGYALLSRCTVGVHDRRDGEHDDSE